MTGIQLEPMTNTDTFQFVEKGMGGGISHFANHFGKVNNKCMKNYDDKKSSKYILYLDANNLYGWLCPNVYLLVVSNGGWKKNLQRYTLANTQKTVKKK